MIRRTICNLSMPAACVLANEAGDQTTIVRRVITGSRIVIWGGSGPRSRIDRSYWSGAAAAAAPKHL